MGAIVKELKEKIVAAGGDVTGVQTVSEALDKLPAGGGSGGVFVINGTKEGSNIVSNKTCKEILDAVSRKEFIILVVFDETDGINCSNWVFRSIEGGSEFVFASLLDKTYTVTLYAESQDDYPWGEEPIG